MATLADDFERITRLCEELEDAAPMSPRVRQRIIRAYTRAMEKAFVIAWDGVPDEDYVARSLFRHAERGARDYLPPSE